jgi:hypothetical protein
MGPSASELTIPVNAIGGGAAWRIGQGQDAVSARTAQKTNTLIPVIPLYGISGKTQTLFKWFHLGNFSLVIFSNPKNW